MERWVARQNIERLRKLLSGEQDIDRRRTLEHLLIEQEATSAGMEDQAVARHDRAKRWRAKAEELRVVADQMTNRSAQADLRRLAADYETLADQDAPSADPQRKQDSAS